MVRVFDGNRLLLWDTRSPQKVAIELTPPKELLNSKGKTASQLLAQMLNANPQKGKKVGTEKVAGYLCDVYLNETPQGKQKVWLAKDLGVPLLLRAQFTGAMGSMELVAESVKTNAKIEESLFRLPAGYSITKPPAGPPGGPSGAPPSKR
jgi:outer membrane lipoprotein-sorting protein